MKLLDGLINLLKRKLVKRIVDKSLKMGGYENKSFSYHDVTVYVNDVKYNLFNSVFGLSLQCCRVGGWQLWYTDITKSGRSEAKLLGGEWEIGKFKIMIGEVVICDVTNTEPSEEDN